MSRAGDSLREPFPGYPPPITTQPEGLLDLLGLQTNGRYPQHFDYNSLGASLDLTRWYLEQRATFVSGVINVAAVAGTWGTDTLLQVPANQHWILLSFNIMTTGVLAANHTNVVGRTNNAGASFVALGAATTQPTGAVGVWGSDPGFAGTVLRPTVQIGVMHLVATALNYNYVLRYVRLTTG